MTRQIRLCDLCKLGMVEILSVKRKPHAACAMTLDLLPITCSQYLRTSLEIPRTFQNCRPLSDDEKFIGTVLAGITSNLTSNYEAKRVVCIKLTKRLTMLDPLVLLAE